MKVSKVTAAAALIALAGVLPSAQLRAEAQAPLRLIRVESLEPATMTAVEAAALLRGPGTPALAGVPGDIPAEAAFLMGAAHAPGSFGSNFVSDLYIVNPMATGSLTINIFALRQNVDNVLNPPSGGSVTIPSRASVVLPDIVGQLGESGGFTLLFGVDKGASTALTYNFTAWAYTWTTSAIGGKFGANLASVNTAYLDFFWEGWCVGATTVNGNRTQVGVFNPNTSRIRVDAEVTSVTGAGGTVAFDVPPLSFIQANIAGLAGIDMGIVHLHWVSGPAGGTYAAYMVVNDNVTSDGNFQLATRW